MSTSLVKKLRIQPSQNALIRNPHKGYFESLENLPENIRLFEQFGEEFDFFQIILSDMHASEKLGLLAVKSIVFGGLLWISYSKRSSKIQTDSTLDTRWERMKEIGVRPATQISTDEAWSAMRLRSFESIGK